jgi:hypothetical protein
VKLSRTITVLLASPALAYVALSLWTARFAFRTLTLPTGVEMAQYLEISPATLALAFIAVSGLSAATASLLIWAVRQHPSPALVVSAATSLILASVVAGTTMWIGWVENSQGEIHGPGYVDWFYWSGIGLTWFIPVHLASFVVIAVVGGLATLARGCSRSAHAA